MLIFHDGVSIAVLAAVISMCALARDKGVFMFQRKQLSVSIGLVVFLSGLNAANAAQDQEARIQALEIQLKNQQQKIAVMEQKSATAKKSSASFNPDISLILSGRYVDFSSGEALDHAELLSGEEEGIEAGFGLGESELILSANVDEHFYGQMTVAFASEEGESLVEIEEAFVQSTLAPGAKIKAGRFFSGFGYQNEQHAHAWDLSVAPLAYRYMLGGSLVDDGLQATYLLPTEMLVLVGAELLKGQAYPATEDSELGAWTTFINVGADIGERASWMLGISHYDGNAVERGIESEPLDALDGTAFFSGDVTLNSLEAVFKFAPTGNMKQQHFKLQAEYLEADDKGEWQVETLENFSGSSAYNGEREGYYLQATYQWNPRWRTSLRYDSLEGELSVNADALSSVGLTTPWEAEQTSAAFDWMPSEFSRVRLQYTHDDTDIDRGDMWLVEYTVSLGAHGAHRY